MALKTFREIELLYTARVLLRPFHLTLHHKLHSLLDSTSPYGRIFLIEFTE